MLSEELDSIHTALGLVLSKANSEGAAIIRLCRRNLLEAKKEAARMEDLCSPISDYNIIHGKHGKETKYGQN